MPRNPLIARILYYMGCTDGIGNGLQKVSDVSWQLDKGGVTVWVSGGRIKQYNQRMLILIRMKK